MPTWLKQERGSFTLESTIVFPILLALILFFIVFGMLIYQKAVLYYAGSVTAERAAFSWDNSHRDPRSGLLPVAQYDGLYRRIGADGALASLFGLNGEGADAAEELPIKAADESGDTRAGQGSKLAHRKILKSAQWLSDAGAYYEGQISYVHGMFKKKIEVQLKQPLELLPAEQWGEQRETSATAAAVIVDPIEFIRSVDLLRYYTLRFTRDDNGASSARANAGEVLASYRE